jgi:hypothetical protein
MNPQTIIFIIVGAMGVNIVFKIVKNRGWKGWLFGAPVGQNIGELELPRRGLSKTTLKVHLLVPRDAGEGPHVGVEVIQSTIGSWEVKPVSLTRAEARRFAETLLRAAERSESGTTAVAPGAGAP